MNSEKIKNGNYVKGQREYTVHLTSYKQSLGSRKWI